MNSFTTKLKSIVELKDQVADGSASGEWKVSMDVACVIVTVAEELHSLHGWEDLAFTSDDIENFVPAFSNYVELWSENTDAIMHKLADFGVIAQAGTDVFGRQLFVMGSASQGEKFDLYGNFACIFKPVNPVDEIQDCRSRLMAMEAAWGREI